MPSIEKSKGISQEGIKFPAQHITKSLALFFMPKDELLKVPKDSFCFHQFLQPMIQRLFSVRYHWFLFVTSACKPGDYFMQKM